MDTKPELNNRDDFVSLNEKFREVKHSINNSLAVIMALSELAQRNSQHYEKLSKTVLSRCPDIVAQLQDFSRALGGKDERSGCRRDRSRCRRVRSAEAPRVRNVPALTAGGSKP